MVVMESKEARAGLKRGDKNIQPGPWSSWGGASIRMASVYGKYHLYYLNNGLMRDKYLSRKTGFIEHRHSN